MFVHKCDVFTFSKNSPITVDILLSIYFENMFIQIKPFVQRL